ncbi:HTTM domain-containing protein [uncultured Chitinophaga sp.]|jgi:Vitamin K-dependent gamma-carboxylase.|uniref:HTTM domain-containing protein n=1 Tax=uncultured Chitinophaga sp. TaxID=339340 RepID=UPI0026343D9F|nr:HTTM domain-containing protein [uncultured Chitinophaga sp.]
MGINIQRPVHIAPLVTFRVAFGAMMLLSIIRFWVNGWITSLYVTPRFYFPLQGLNWVRPLGAAGMHILFIVMALAALLIMLGCCYRAAAVIFFLAFTYVELIDITNYLNHYYFISIISFLLIWVPANAYYSLDTRWGLAAERTRVPAWTIGIFRLQLLLVYFFAGLAKLNYDWLLEAQPMKIWLPAKSHLPLIGPLMYKEWVAYFFSWFGACYDLFIAFFLLNRRTRTVAYCFVVAFHLATALFFPGIGMFPYVMIVSSLIFFSSDFHLRLLRYLPFFKNKQGTTYTYPPVVAKLLMAMLCLHFIIQLLLPFRYLLYPGRLFWTEEGFRFSWRVMLMEKSGNIFFYVKEPATGKTYEVNNREFLTPLQDKMMSTQPDMILQYAHHLAAVYAARGVREPEVYVESYVALNGKRSRLYIDSTVNLAAQHFSWRHYQWILPYKEKHE